MDNPQQPTMTTTSPTAMHAPSGLFGTRIPSLAAFGVGLLLFLLPFAEIKCGGTVLANKSGVDIALKHDWKSAQKKDLTGSDDTGLSDSQKKSQGNSWIFAIAGLALGALGLLLCFADSKTGGSAGTALGILAGGALIGLMVIMKKDFNDSLAKDAVDKTQQGANNFGLDKLSNTMNNVKPTLNFTPWFYVAVIAFLAAAFFCYQRMRSARR